MSNFRRQAHIEAPIRVVWELVSNPNRHPEWIPRVVEVECSEIGEGCTYRRVFKTPIGTDETTLEIEKLDDCHELSVHCLDSGTFNRFVLTEAQGGTFVELEAGMDPATPKYKMIDTVTGKRFYRRWTEQTLNSLREAAGRELASREAA
jgi:uncharacterized protein YndB with AHSA1/START domain